MSLATPTLVRIVHSSDEKYSKLEFPIMVQTPLNINKMPCSRLRKLLKYRQSIFLKSSSLPPLINHDCRRFPTLRSSLLTLPPTYSPSFSLFTEA